MATRVIGEHLDYLHYTKDDDFTVDLNSNDVNAVRLMPDVSVRAHWELKLLLKLRIRQKEYEVAVAKFICRNHQTNSPKLVRLVNASSGTVLVERPLARDHYAVKGDLLAGVYEALKRGKKFPKFPTYPQEEFYVLAVNFAYDEYAFVDLNKEATEVVNSLGDGRQIILENDFWINKIHTRLKSFNVDWRQLQTPRENHWTH